MWRELRWIAILLTIAIQTQTIAYASNTQNKRVSPTSDIRVISVTPDAAGNFVLLNTLKSRQLPFPIMRYMPAPDGRSMMTVDFPGARFEAAQAVMNFDQSLVRQVRIGQLQSFPPIMRISMVADRTDVFGKVDFRSSPGALTIRLPSAITEPAPAPVPAPAVKQSYEQPKPAPAIANDAQYLPMPEEHKGGKLKRFFKKLFAPTEPAPEAEKQPEPEPKKAEVVPKPAPNVVRKPTPRAAPAPTPMATSGNTLHISVSTADKFAVTMTGSSHFTFRSFRLANPDRLVVDLAGLQQPSVQVDALTDNNLVRGIRVGNPDGNPNITRVVFDLATAQVADTPSLQESAQSSSLCIILQKDDRAPIANQEAKPLRAGTTIVLDAGHGGSDPGAQRGDIQEKAMTLGIVEKLRRSLEQHGIKVILTRSDDTFVSLEDRVKITNSIHPDAFVSIHINSLETNTHTTGIETYYQNDASKDLAKFIHLALVNGLAAPDRGVRKARFYVINHTPVPAILAEVGFISNKEERDKLVSSDYQAQIATAVADGVISFLTGSASGSGTISATPPSTPQQSFTQNLQTAKPSDQKVAQQQLRSKTKHVAATRSF